METSPIRYNYKFTTQFVNTLFSNTPSIQLDLDKIFSSTGFKSRVRIPRWTSTKPRWRNKEIPPEKIDTPREEANLYEGNLQSIST